MATVAIRVASKSGTAGMKLELYPEASSAIANGAGGDTLTETGSTGWFTATVAEALTGIHDAVVKSSAGAVLLEGGKVEMSDASPVVDRVYEVDGYTLEGATKIILAAAAGKLSGAGTATEVFRAVDDSKARITATVDSSGNRSAITLDGTG